MKELTDYILEFGQLNQHQIDLIARKGTGLTLKEGDYFSEAGKVSQRVGSILVGVIRVCYYNNKGQEIMRHFIDENNFVVDLNSFETGVLTVEYIQAVTDFFTS